MHGTHAYWSWYAHADCDDWPGSYRRNEIVVESSKWNTHFTQHLQIRKNELYLFLFVFKLQSGSEHFKPTAYHVLLSSRIRTDRASVDWNVALWNKLNSKRCVAYPKHVLASLLASRQLNNTHQIISNSTVTILIDYERRESYPIVLNGFILSLSGRSELFYNRPSFK